MKCLKKLRNDVKVFLERLKVLGGDIGVNNQFMLRTFPWEWDELMPTMLQSYANQASKHILFTLLLHLMISKAALEVVAYWGLKNYRHLCNLLHSLMLLMK
jgi:hypothetical protein